MITRLPQRKTRVDAPDRSDCPESLERAIAVLKQDLDVARDQIAVLSTRLDRLLAIFRDRGYSSRSPAAFVNTHPALTPREREIVLTFLDRPSDKEVACCLGIKLQTVRNQFVSIQNKLGVASREELVILLLSHRDGQPHA